VATEASRGKRTSMLRKKKTVLKKHRTQVNRAKMGPSQGPARKGTCPGRSRKGGPPGNLPGAQNRGREGGGLQGRIKRPRETKKKKNPKGSQRKTGTFHSPDALGGKKIPRGGGEGGKNGRKKHDVRNSETPARGSSLKMEGKAQEKKKNERRNAVPLPGEKSEPKITIPENIKGPRID